MARRADFTPGFTLLEVTLATAVGIVLLAGITVAFRMYGDQARIGQAKTNLGTIRNNINMYKYRMGAYPPTGAVANASWNSGSATVTITNPGGSFSAATGQNTVVLVGALPTGGACSAPVFTVQSVAAGSLTLSPPYPTNSGSGYALQGVMGNVDDQGCNFLPEPSQAATVSGMGLSDPWTNDKQVRAVGSAGLPTWNDVSPKAGYQFNSANFAAGTDVWGGLSYDPASGDVQYVLPDPSSANQPPGSVGYFPGDPPMSWGK